MADPVIDPKVDPPAEPRGTDPSAVPDPRDARLAELEEYAARAQATFEQLKPIEADIEALVKDEGYREFTRTSRESYYDMQKRIAKEKEAEIPEGEKRLLEEIDKRLRPALEEVGVLRTEREQRAAREAEAAKEATQEFAKRETEFAQRLVAEQKLTSEEVQDLGEYAMALHKKSVEAGAPRFVGIEEVYKRVYGRAEAKVAAPVPKSLRAKAGATGVPGASKPTPDPREDLSKPGGVTRHMLSVLNAQRKTG
jgi:hypothetical protein